MIQGLRAAEMEQQERDCAILDLRALCASLEQRVAEESAAASAWNSEHSVFTSSREEAVIAQCQQDLLLAQERLASLEDQRSCNEERIIALEGRALEIAAQQSEVQAAYTRLREEYGDVLETAEALDTTRNISYVRTFGINGDANRSVWDPTHNPEHDMDAGLRDTLEEGWANGHENCCIYVLHALEEAGYDMDEEVLINGEPTTVRRLVLIHAETLLPDREASLTDIATDPEHRYHMVLKGVVTALTASGQGTEVNGPNDVRPGDLLQWWTEGDSGHTTIIHTVNTDQGPLTTGMGPAHVSGAVEVETVHVLGSHQTQAPMGAGADATAEEKDLKEREGQDHVYVTGEIRLDEGGKGEITYAGSDKQLTAWWAVRPTGSIWAKPLPF